MNIHPFPPTLHAKKSKKFENFQNTREWCETFKNVVKSVQSSEMSGKRPRKHFLRAYRISNHEKNS